MPVDFSLMNFLEIKIILHYALFTRYRKIRRTGCLK